MGKLNKIFEETEDFKFYTTHFPKYFMHFPYNNTWVLPCLLSEFKTVIKLTACVLNSLWQNKHNIKSPTICSKLQGMRVLEKYPSLPLNLPCFLATLSSLKLFVDFVLRACFYARNIQIMPGQRLWAVPRPPTHPQNFCLSG